MNNNSDVKKASPVTVTFIILQLFFILVLIFSIPSLFPNDHIESTETTRQPKIIIENIETVTPKLSNFDINSIQQKLLKTVQDNTSTVNVIDTKAIVRSDATKIIPQFGDSGLNYLSTILDIPDLKQSYKLFYEYPNDSYSQAPDPHRLFLITCLNKLDQIIYPDFTCHDSYDSTIYNGVVAKYISYLSNDHFSLFVSNTDISVLYINPIDSNFESHKQNYIEQAKDTIKSLGVPSEIFSYHFPDYSNQSYDYYERNKN